MIHRHRLCVCVGGGPPPVNSHTGNRKRNPTAGSWQSQCEARLPLSSKILGMRRGGCILLPDHVEENVAQNVYERSVLMCCSASPSDLHPTQLPAPLLGLNQILCGHPGGRGRSLPQLLFKILKLWFKPLGVLSRGPAGWAPAHVAPRPRELPAQYRGVRYRVPFTGFAARATVFQ